MTETAVINPPEWRLRVESVSDADTLQTHLDYAVFGMATGAVLAVWLRLEFGPDRVFAIHKVFDLAEPADLGFLQAVRGAGGITLLVEDKGTGHQVRWLMTLDADKLGTTLDAGRRYASFRSPLDGARAVRDFFAIYEPALKQYDDVIAGWTAVQTAQDARLAAEQRALEQHERRRKRFYWFARTLQVVASVPVIGGWILTLSVPLVVLAPLLWLGVVGGDDKSSAMFIYFLTATAWLVYLDRRGIVRVTMPIPLVEIPAWPFFLFFTLSALSARMC
jgi:hypothetical protein